MSNAKATELAAGLRALAVMVESNPDLADHLSTYTFSRLLVSCWERETVAEFARAGARTGAKVEKHQSDKWAGVDVLYGPLALHVYTEREKVCEKVVTGTREVTEEIPDPNAPKVTVTRTVEDVEWVCRPLLADEASDAGKLVSA